MSTPYEDMSYDELAAIEDKAEPMERLKIWQIQMLKSAVMTAICKLAAELDEEGLCVVPRETFDCLKDARDMLAMVEVVDGEKGDPWDNAITRINRVLASPNQGETP